MAGERGVTLVELVAGLALALLVAAAVVAVLFGQRAFYAGSSDRAHARQSVRAAADVISGDLRTSVPGDLMAAAAGSVSVRFPVLRAVVCGPALASPGAVAAYVFDTVTNPNLPPGFRGYGVRSPDGPWRRVDRAPLTVDPGAGRSRCVARGAPDADESWRYRTVGGWERSGSFGAVPARGAVLVRYGRLTYSVEPSGWYGSGRERLPGLYRNGQELAAPFASGMAFGYRLDDGTATTTVAPSELDRVRAVLLEATAVPPSPAPGAGTDLRLRVPLAEGRE